MVVGVMVFCVSYPAYAKSDIKSVLKTYADIAYAAYEDSLITAKNLRAAVAVFLRDPNEDTLSSARIAWIAARVPYQQTEVYRFGNTVVDDWEGKVNAWPLDEGLIDYVAKDYGTQSDENEFYAANVIANKILKINGKDVDASVISKRLLSQTLHEVGGIEANVATGYHAIEFLLWGQDIHGTKAGAGNRPASDFSTKACTHGNCDRRADYLRVVVELLIDDLKWMTAQWGVDGAARKKLLMGDERSGLVAIFTGMGSLSYGELAGERMKLGLLLHDPEEEHDCFSDNTHNSHYYNALGIQNVYLGRYKRVNGSFVKGPSVSDLVKSYVVQADQELQDKLNITMDAMRGIVLRAKRKEAYDQMIGEGNDEGHAVVQNAIDALLSQTKAIERVVSVLKLKSIEFEGSESLRRD